MENSIRDAEAKFNAEELFKALKKLEGSEGITEGQAKEMAVELIDVLKGHKLTYRQTYMILDITKDTLRTMSLLLSL